MRIQYHFWPLGNGRFDAWDVHRLIELTQDLPVEDVAVSSIAELDSDYWFAGSAQGPSVREIAEHVRLIQEGDPSYPIILGPAGQVMDGMHRVARAFLEQRSTLPAVRLSTLPAPDHRDCHPDELPY